LALGAEGGLDQDVFDTALDMKVEKRLIEQQELSRRLLYNWGTKILHFDTLRPQNLGRLNRGRVDTTFGQGRFVVFKGRTMARTRKGGRLQGIVGLVDTWLKTGATIAIIDPLRLWPRIAVRPLLEGTSFHGA